MGKLIQHVDAIMIVQSLSSITISRDVNTSVTNTGEW